jgi:meso-butanediol dehydrogenase / (S,S)-butanediol dehydrogenase / diacetyl reductase
MQLNGKITLITGGGGALGLAIARQFVAAGARAVVLADVIQIAVPSDLTGAVDPVTCDVTAASDIASVIADCVRKHGRLDVLVNNAGVLSQNRRIHGLTHDDWARSFAVNVEGSANGIAAAVPPMRSQGGGSIINTGSVSGLTAWSHTGPYGATKAAAIHLTKIAAVEYAPDRIRVNCVCPGTFPSAIHTQLPEGVLDVIGAKHPLGLGTAEDVAGAYLYFACDLSKWTTGAVLAVDGGYSAI